MNLNILIENLRNGNKEAKSLICKEILQNLRMSTLNNYDLLMNFNYSEIVNFWNNNK